LQKAAVSRWLIAALIGRAILPALSLIITEVHALARDASTA